MTDLNKLFMSRMEKPWSVERSIIINMKPKRSWKSGLTTQQILDKVNSERKRNKKYSKGKVYHAISLINRFGSIDYGIYLVSRSGSDEYVTNEHRYFNLKELVDSDIEKRRLEHQKQIKMLKKSNVVYHEEKTIPQEQVIKNSIIAKNEKNN